MTTISFTGLRLTRWRVERPRLVRSMSRSRGEITHTINWCCGLWSCSLALIYDDETAWDQYLAKHPEPEDVTR